MLRAPTGTLRNLNVLLRADPAEVISGIPRTSVARSRHRGGRSGVRRWWIIGTLAVLAACGGGGGSKAKSPASTTTTTLPPTTAKPSAMLTIEPTAGKVGTNFSFSLAGAVPGETVIFHIRFPNNRLREGQGHVVAADGSLKTTYTATAGNPDGEYQVSATGAQGTQASSVFSLGAGTGVPSTATTKARAATTSTTKR
jgi:hypothetical protein